MEKYIIFKKEAGLQNYSKLFLSLGDITLLDKVFSLPKKDKKSLLSFIESVVGGPVVKRDSPPKTKNLLSHLESIYPEIIVYRRYFSKVNSRNDYIAIMKQAVVHHLTHIGKVEKVTYKIMGEIINSDHASAMRYAKASPMISHKNYNEVVLIMDKMIKQGLYPMSNTKTKNGLTQYTWEKLENGS